MAVKLSTLPVALGCLLLFHSILRRFEITPRNAVIGTLTLGLSPLFLPLSASFMTDIPGLFAMLLCLYLCQLALAAGTDRAAIGWLAMAVGTNVIGGTARQLAWLGVLVMVPCTGWLMRKRRKVLIAALWLWASGVGAITLCMQWFAKQPYAIHVSIWPVPAKTSLLGLLGMLYTTNLMFSEFLTVLLGLAPLLLYWLPRFGRRSDHWIALFCVGVLPLLIFRLFFGKYAEVWPPVLLFSELPIESYFRFGSSMSPLYAALPYFAEGVVCLVLMAGLLGLVIAVRENRQAQKAMRFEVLPRNMSWLLGPFSVGYVLLLLTQNWQWIAFERYVIGLVPCAILVVLTLHQRLNRKEIPISMFSFLVLFAAFAVAGTHDWFARQRARLEAIQEVRAAGVSRTEIDGGWEYDGWTQVRDDGHINDPRIKIPVGGYRPTENVRKREVCLIDFRIIREFTDLNVRYAAGTGKSGCTLPSHFADVHYLAWLPPFRRTITVERLPANASNATATSDPEMPRRRVTTLNPN
jgi:hypothetical protein